MAGGLANGVVASLGGEKPSAPDFKVAVSFDGDSAYKTTGTAAFAAFLKSVALLGAIEILGIVANDCGAYVPLYVKATDKLKVFVRATGVEVGNGVDLSGTTFNIVAICK